MDAQLLLQKYDVLPSTFFMLDSKDAEIAYRLVIKMMELYGNQKEQEILNEMLKKYDNTINDIKTI